MHDAVPLGEMELSPEVQPSAPEQADEAQEMAVVPWVGPEEIRSAWMPERRNPRSVGLNRMQRV